MPDVQNSQPAAPSMPQTGAGPQTDFTDPMSLFDAMEKEFFPKDETAPDFRGMKPGKDLNDDEFMNFDPSAKDEQTNEASTDETQALSEGGEVTDDKAAPAKDEFKNFEFEEEIGGQRVHLNIKTPEQLQNVIRRAVIAQNLYEENAKFKAELPALQEAHEYMQDFDRMIEDDPASFISMILEEMPVADVKQLIMNLADAHSKDDGEIERDRRIKKSEYLERKLERRAARGRAD